MSRPIHLLLSNARLHLQHGPIDCIVEAWGAAAEVQAAYAQAIARFEDVLEALVEELAVLRTPIAGAYPPVRGPVAKRMVAAAWPHRAAYITPMAAVAGAVAEELLAALVDGRVLDKAYVNDGGDIALHLGLHAEFAVGIAHEPNWPSLDAQLKLQGTGPVRGIATSGWRGRSQSLGIADAVTVLARSAAAADAAATMIANAVNVDHPAIRRLPARAVKQDSDLGDLPVTVEVGLLPPRAIEEALDAGEKVASSLRARGLIEGAYLALGAQWRIVRTRSLPAMLARC